MYLPSEIKNGVPKIVKTSVSSNTELDKFLKKLGGGVLSTFEDRSVGMVSVEKKYDDVVDGSMYFLFDRNFDAALNLRVFRSQVEDRIVEEEVTLALVKDIGEGTHVHRNVKFMDRSTKKDIAEINNVVIQKGVDNVSNSVAYIVEYALSPQKKDVQRLLDTLDVFKTHAHSSPHFISVMEVVPVLGGKMWSEEVVQECIAVNKTRVQQGFRPILRVHPSGNDFKVIRMFSTFASKLLKRL